MSGLLNVTESNKTYSGVDSTTEHHTPAYVFVLVGVLVLLLALAVFVVIMVIRNNRLEQLRHHLMPMYNFDPQEEDWESELLDDRGRRVSYREGSLSPTSPQLKLMNT